MAVHSAAMETVAPSPVRPRVSAPLFGMVFLGLIAQVPATARPALTVRFAFVAVAAAIGVPLLVRHALQRDRAALLGTAVVAWALISTLLSGAVAWFGDFFALTGMVFVAACLGSWAIGRVLPTAALPALVTAILAGAVINATVAVGQGFVDLSAFEVALYDGRATGLMGNPVFLGALCAAAMAFVPTALRYNAAVGAGAALLLAAATQMSGARNSVVVLLVVAAWVAVRAAARHRALVVAAVVAGLAIGVVVEPTHGTAAVARLGTSSGLSNRIENWREGLIAAAERPLVGHGPGRYGPAVSPHRTAELSRQGPDRLYADAHNIGVEYAVTIGFFGLALLAAWAVAALRRSWPPRRADLLVGAAALFSAHLLQPQHLVLTPLLFLLVGAARTGTEHRSDAPLPVRAAQAALVLVALAVAGRILVGDVTFRAAELDFDLEGAERASDLLWPWARPVSLETRIHLFRAREQKDPNELPAALEAARRARSREPGEPIRHVAVASILLDLGRRDEALRAYREALRRNPWSAQALRGRADVLDAVGRRDQAAACRAASELETRSGSGLRRSHSECLGP